MPGKGNEQRPIGQQVGANEIEEENVVSDKFQIQLGAVMTAAALLEDDSPIKTALSEAIVDAVREIDNLAFMNEVLALLKEPHVLPLRYDRGAVASLTFWSLRPSDRLTRRDFGSWVLYKRDPLILADPSSGFSAPVIRWDRLVGEELRYVEFSDSFENFSEKAFPSKFWLSAEDKTAVEALTRTQPTIWLDSSDGLRFLLEKSPVASSRIWTKQQDYYVDLHRCAGSRSVSIGECRVSRLTDSVLELQPEPDARKDVLAAVDNGDLLALTGRTDAWGSRENTVLRCFFRSPSPDAPLEHSPVWTSGGDLMSFDGNDEIFIDVPVQYARPCVERWWWFADGNYRIAAQLSLSETAV